MLECLESAVPAVRLASKSWLAISTNYFRWILDPLLQVLLHEHTEAEKGVNNDIYFKWEYENRQVLQVFSMLRSIMLNCPNELINYIVN